MMMDSFRRRRRRPWRIITGMVLLTLLYLVFQNIYSVHTNSGGNRYIHHLDYIIQTILPEENHLGGGILTDNNNFVGDSSSSTGSDNTTTELDDASSSHIIQMDDNPYFLSEEYRLKRRDQFYTWYEGTNQTDTLFQNADANGPILDFAIAGLPKTGTTSLSSALYRFAPMEEGDVCTNSAQIVYYSYKNWPSLHGEDKTMRGSKCPALLEGYVENYGLYVPRTKLIFGVRHPVLWFQSFWNQQAVNGLTNRLAENDPYNLMHVCDTSRGCNIGCYGRKLFCLGRSRFHLAIAKLGKTELSTTERQLLAPNDRDGGNNLKNLNISNPLFLYETSELQEDYFWFGLTKFLGIQNDTVNPRGHHHSRGYRNKDTIHKIKICDEKFDQLRATIMPYSYELSTWLQEYFIPVAQNRNRTDVHVAHPQLFANLVEKYKEDPCNRLIRLNNGTYTVK